MHVANHYSSAAGQRLPVVLKLVIIACGRQRIEQRERAVDAMQEPGAQTGRVTPQATSLERLDTWRQQAGSQVGRRQDKQHGLLATIHTLPKSGQRSQAVRALTCCSDCP